MDNQEERELAGLLVLENKLVDERDKIIQQLEPVRMRVNELIRLKRLTAKMEVGK